jgi:hypothetical protein
VGWLGEPNNDAASAHLAVLFPQLRVAVAIIGIKPALDRRKGEL